VSAQDGNELYSVFPSATGSAASIGVPKDANYLPKINIYPSTSIRLGRVKNGEQYPPAPPPGVTVIYGLTAVDTAVGRRYWESTTVDFASAPAPVGSWVLESLTVMYIR